MTYSRIISTAASYFNPSSISANATKTGALPKPATQCTATHASGFSWYLNEIRIRINQFIQLDDENLLLFQRIKPIINNLLGWWCAIFKWKITYSNALRLQLFNFVAWFADTYNNADIIFL